MILSVLLNVSIRLRHQSGSDQSALDHLPAVKIPVAVSESASRQLGSNRAVEGVTAWEVLPPVCKTSGKAIAEDLANSKKNSAFCQCGIYPLAFLFYSGLPVSFVILKTRINRPQRLIRFRWY